MDTATIRQQLHHYIDTTDDKRIEALFSILEHDILTDYTFTPDELRIFNERAENYLSGNTKTFTIEESNNLIRTQYRKN